MCLIEVIILVVCSIIAGQSAGRRGIPPFLAMGFNVFITLIGWMIASVIFNPLVLPLVPLTVGGMVIFFLSLFPLSADSE